jgi:hypothetical protein
MNAADKYNEEVDYSLAMKINNCKLGDTFYNKRSKSFKNVGSSDTVKKRVIGTSHARKRL